MDNLTKKEKSVLRLALKVLYDYKAQELHDYTQEAERLKIDGDIINQHWQYYNNLLDDIVNLKIKLK